MKKMRIVSILTLFLITVSGVFSNASADNKVVKWRLQASYPIGTSPTNHALFWADRIEKITNGRLKVKVLPPGAMCSVKDIVIYLERGVFDAAVTFGGFYTGLIPETDLEMGLPLSFQTWTEAWDCFYNRGLWEIVQNGYDRHDIIWFPGAAEKVYHFMTKFPITNIMEDLKGKKLRAVGIYGKYTAALGASTVAIPGAEMYMALKLGTIDGALYGASGLQESKLAEVVDYYVLPPVCQITESLLFSKKSLNKLPEDLRAIVRHSARSIMAEAGRQFEVDSVLSYETSIREGSVKPIFLSEEDQKKMRTVIRPLWDELATKSPNMKKGVEIIKQYMREVNRPMD
jgi:TRAP-type C4-dicarboxylate transport system substrate-binding protein